MIVEWESAVRNAERLSALERSTIVGVSSEDAFDRLVELALEVTGAARGCITFVDAERATAFSAAGFAEGTPVYARIEDSFCRFVVGTGRPFIVEDANSDPRTIGDSAIEVFTAVSWIGYAIEDVDGIALGTFCLMDSEPREWTAKDIRCIATLARAASTEIALRMARAEFAAMRGEMVGRGA